MSTLTSASEAAAQTAVEIASKVLSLPTVRSQAASLADVAARDGATQRAHLAELLAAEVDARLLSRRERRIKEARFPRMTTLASFNFDAAP
jgi:hypothetical protein